MQTHRRRFTHYTSLLAKSAAIVAWNHLPEVVKAAYDVSLIGNKSEIVKIDNVNFLLDNFLSITTEIFDLWRSRLL